MLLTVTHNVRFLQDLAIVMIVAGLVTVLFHRLKQPVVLGYIIAGVIIGPHTPPFPLIADERPSKLFPSSASSFSCSRSGWSLVCAN